MSFRPEDEPEVKIVTHKLITYKVDPSYPEYVKRLWVMNRYAITFYDEHMTPLEVYDRNTGVIYKLMITPEAQYVEPWFAQIQEIENMIRQHGEEYVIEWILKTVKDYFSVIDDDDE